jgi:hypothetical protein
MVSLPKVKIEKWFTNSSVVVKAVQFTNFDLKPEIVGPMAKTRLILLAITS